MRGKRGFTLIETVVALGILTAALAGAITLIFQTVNLAINTRNATAGNSYMQGRMSDAISAICTGCTPGDSVTALLGTGVTACLNDLGEETTYNEGTDSCSSGHKVVAYIELDHEIDDVLFDNYLFIDTNFSAINDNLEIIDPGLSGAGPISRDNFIRVVSKLKWDYKGRTYSDSIIQYVGKGER